MSYARMSEKQKILAAEVSVWVRVMPDTASPSTSASMGTCQCSALPLPPEVCPEAS